MKIAMPRLCLVEDDAIMGESLYDRFQLEGFEVDWYQDATSALDGIVVQDYQLVISDFRLPGMNGEELFARILERGRPHPPFLFITGYGSIDKAVHLLKMGAADYVTKPFDLEQLVQKAKELSAHATTQPAEVDAFEPSLGISAAMRQIEESIHHLAPRAKTILLTGESGVGKEYVARLLHSCGSGSEAPFVAVNCGALTESLLEAELFGYEKGAFTGALRTKKGVFELAHGGTLLLDEIGEMPLLMQVRLLRAIQERTVVRVGGEQPIPVDLRLICATNRDLKCMVEQGNFREDLYYRINVIHLRIPPLRERKEDVLWFAQQYLQEYAAEHPDEHRLLSHEAEQAMLDYPWPGNIRELRHSLERAAILARHERLQPGDIFEMAMSAETAVPPTCRSPESDDLHQYLRACERAYILRALEQHNWHMGETAAHLGISRKNLWEKMKKQAISGKTTDNAEE